MEGGFDLPAGVLGPELIEQVFEWNEIGQTFLGIFIVIDCNEADLLFREVEFQVVIHRDVFTAEPGKVFHQDTVDFSSFNVIQHPLKARTFKVCARPAIIHIFVHNKESLVMGIGI